MLVTLFALIALASVVVFDGTDDATDGEQDEAPRDNPFTRRRLRVRAARHTVVTDLDRARRDGERLVLEYDAARPVPDLRLEHEGGRSVLYADDRLVLEVQGEAEPPLTLSEIELQGVPRD